ncbi:MAG: hypothetical protein INR73_22165 [Williamsia sp.]|nr:hypothetical protein [Williamsia sp.]
MLAVPKYAYEYLENESLSLLSRLKQLKPFSMTMPMVKGASVSNEALKSVIELLEKGKKLLYASMSKFIDKVNASQKEHDDPARLQTEFTILKLRFNSILDQLDIFADVLSQRAEHEVGIWLCGLDVLAEDGLTPCKGYFDPPSMMVFLERGHGAAIRRARTRLPGGDLNPVAVIQIPRERMVGSGIASSLIHEVGHQVAESMDINKSLRTQLALRQRPGSPNIDAWKHYERWISEITADYWAMGQLGIAATLGLMGVVTLPKYFQFRLDLDDPHPAPYVRVQVNCAFGKAFFPHPQWDRIWNLWKLFYPVEDLPEDKQILLEQLEEELPDFVELVNNHKPLSLNGRSLQDLLPVQQRQPATLQQLYQQWKKQPLLMEKAAPTLVFAVMGQAKSDLVLQADEESQILTQQLRNWAFNRN